MSIWVPPVNLFTGSGGRAASVWRHQRWIVSAGLMEKTMSKTNDTSRPATLEDRRPLADSELDAVTGGLVVLAIIQPLISLLLPAVQSARQP